MNRALRPEEVDLLRWLIAHGTREAARFTGQTDRVRVVSECTCGCPTIDLGLDDEPKQVGGGSLVVSDWVGRSPEGIPVGVLLHTHAGVLSEMEVYSLDGRGPFSLPRPEDLKPWEESAK